MTIKFANYAAFTAAEKKVARDVQAFRQMMSGNSAKTSTAASKTDKPAASKGPSTRKGHTK
ncbi:MAG TPA: hypothetical protein VF534_09350 [Paraburkholderia sp.]